MPKSCTGSRYTGYSSTSSRLRKVASAVTGPGRHDVTIGEDQAALGVDHEAGRLRGGVPLGVEGARLVDLDRDHAPGDALERHGPVRIALDRHGGLRGVGLLTGLAPGGGGAGGGGPGGVRLGGAPGLAFGGGGGGGSAGAAAVSAAAALGPEVAPGGCGVCARAAQE